MQPGKGARSENTKTHGFLIFRAARKRRQVRKIRKPIVCGLSDRAHSGLRPKTIGFKLSGPDPLFRSAARKGARSEKSENDWFANFSNLAPFQGCTRERNAFRSLSYLAPFQAARRKGWGQLQQMRKIVFLVFRTWPRVVGPGWWGPAFPKEAICRLRVAPRSETSLDPP